jgi:hypothetical protein
MNNLIIRYIFTSPSVNGSSVQTKVLNQINYLNKAGAECRGVFFSKEVTEITKLNETVDLIPVNKCSWKYFRKIGQKYMLEKVIYNYVKDNYSNTDYFYFRFSGSSYVVYLIAKNFGKKIISEHQSKEIDEIKSMVKNNLFGFKPTKLLSWVQFNFIPMFNEKLFINNQSNN